MASEDKGQNDTVKDPKAAEPQAEQSDAESADDQDEVTEPAESKGKSPDGDTAEATSSDAEKPADEPHPGTEPQQSIDELDEGWPRAWIVTTAVLGVVAILIVARLVGQTWRKDPPKPGPGPGEMVAKKGGEPAKRPEGKRPHGDEPPPPGDEPKGEKPGDEAVDESQRTIVVEAGKVTVPPGLHCLTTKGTLRAMEELAMRPKECIIEVGPSANIRFEIDRTQNSELTLMLVPAIGEGESDIVSGFVAPFEAKTYWIGARTGKLKQPMIVAVVRHPNPKPIDLAGLRLLTTPSFDSGVKDPAMHVKFADVTVTGPGDFCLTKEKKLVAIEPDKALPGECHLKAEGSSAYDLSLSAASSPAGLRVYLMPPHVEMPPMLEVSMIPFEQPGITAHRASLRGGPVPVVGLRFATKQKGTVKFSSIILKGQPM